MTRQEPAEKLGEHRAPPTFTRGGVPGFPRRTLPAAQDSEGDLVAKALRQLCGLSETPSAAGKNHSPPQRFAVIPSYRHPRCLLPLGDKRWTLSGLAMVHPRAWRWWVPRAVLFGVVKTGWKGWAWERISVDQHHLRAFEGMVERVTGEANPAFAILVGRRGLYRKLTIQVISPDGKILCYAKLPLSEASGAHLQHEAEVLHRLGGFAALRGRLPEVLHRQEWQAGYVVFQSARSGRTGPTKFTRAHERFLRHLWEAREVQKPGEVVVGEVRERWQDAAHLLTPEQRRAGDLSLQQAGQLLEGVAVRCGCFHGDFAPGNTLVQPNGELFVFDWELAEFGQPNLWDVLNFHAVAAVIWRRPEMVMDWARLGTGDWRLDEGLLRLYLVNSLCLLMREGAAGRERAIAYRHRWLERAVAEGAALRGRPVAPGKPPAADEEHRLHALKRLSYREGVSRWAGKFGVRKILRSWYYRWARPAGGILPVQVNGVSARFHVRSYRELRILEAVEIGERAVLDLMLKFLAPGDVVYDVGANIGIYSILLAKSVGEHGKVVAFEPEKQSHLHLLENLSLNSVKGVQCIQKALGAEPGEGHLFVRDGVTCPRLSAPPSGSMGGQVTRESVEIANGDRLVAEENLPVPRAVKIDVEGHEFAVLQGLRRTLAQPACELVCCEIHPHLLPAGVTEEAIREFLVSRGFSRVEKLGRERDENFFFIAHKQEASFRPAMEAAVSPTPALPVRPYPEAQTMRRILVGAYVCLVSPEAEVPGGGDLMAWNLVKHLSREHRLWVLTAAQNRAAIERALETQSLPNVEFVYVGLPHWLHVMIGRQVGVQLYAYLWQWKAYFAARKLHRKLRFDLYHHLTYENDWMASIIGALLPIPYVRGPGGGAHRIPREFLMSFRFWSRLGEYRRILGQWIFRHDPFFVKSQQRAQVILACNREAVEGVPARWRDKVQLASVNGISREELALPQSAAAGQGFTVLSAGRLVPLKGFDLALQTFAKFAKNHPQASFTIIGKGPELGRLENLIRTLGIEKQARIEKWLPRERLLLSMRTCDVFLFASMRDGGGLVVVEAMAAGRPVVCLDLGGPGLHITPECGFKVPANSPDEAVGLMAQALEKLYQDSGLRARMSQAARARAEQVYCWDMLGERILGIYGEALGIPRGSNGN